MYETDYSGPAGGIVTVSLVCMVEDSLRLPVVDSALTQLDVPVQREQDVPSLQVSVDDFVVVEVDEGQQSLLTHHPDLRLGQRSLQLYVGSQDTCLELTHMQPNHR